MTTHQSLLSAEQWRRLIESVFKPAADERRLALLVDIPDDGRPDDPPWLDRRRLAQEWLEGLRGAFSAERLEIELWLYPNARTNNGDLPDRVWEWGDLASAPLPSHVRELPEAGSSPFSSLFETCPLFIAMSELSATAPLKVAARQYGFRAATMPGFAREMMPALALDFEDVDRRCRVLKSLLDRAERADFLFETLPDGQEHRLRLDLRHRQSHASSGLLKTPGTAGNLPSGETYIVPYEGELTADPSRSEGHLPVELDGEVVVYEIRANRAVRAQGQGPRSEVENQRLEREPAYANVAELGLGVLGELGVDPVGEILLDEKLGLHIAFGRSDHFGGQVGPDDFSSKAAVVHIDRVYLPLPEAKVRSRSVRLSGKDGRGVDLMADGRYLIDFAAQAEDLWKA